MSWALAVLVGGAACSDDEASTEVVGRTTSTTVADPPAGDGAAGDLEFRPVLERVPLSDDGTADLGTVTGDATPDTVVSDDGEIGYVLGAVVLDARGVEAADARRGGSGQWEVVVTFRDGDPGIDTLNAVAADCVVASQECPTGQLAILVDGEVVSAPTILEDQFAPEVIISGFRGVESEADDGEAVARSLAAAIDPTGG